MIDLTHNEQAALRRLVAAGAEGLPIGAALAPDAADLLAHHGFAVIARNGDAARAYATSRGGIFAYRGAA